VGVEVAVREHDLHLTAEVDVHERVDDRVGDVLEEEDVEDEANVGQELERHEEGWRERQHEDDSDDKQHGRRADVSRQALTISCSSSSTRRVVRSSSRSRRLDALNSTIIRHLTCTNHTPPWV